MFNLQVYEEVLTQQVKKRKLSRKTAEYYISNLKKLEQICMGQEGSSAGILEVSIRKICQDGKQIPKYVAAVKKYERDVLGSPKLLLYGEPLIRLRSSISNISKNQGKELKRSQTTYKHKINALLNEKLKLAFRLQEKSGLRISEIANLRAKDIYFNETGGITLKVRNGKGRKQRKVEVIEDLYLKERLSAYMDQFETDEKLFYSASYMKKKAGEYGMETHDLRRINARERFRAERNLGSTKTAARRAVGKQLGHNDPKTTNLYLGEEWKEKRGALSGEVET